MDEPPCWVRRTIPYYNQLLPTANRPKIAIDGTCVYSSPNYLSILSYYDYRSASHPMALVALLITIIPRPSLASNAQQRLVIQ